EIAFTFAATTAGAAGATATRITATTRATETTASTVSEGSSRRLLTSFLSYEEGGGTREDEWMETDDVFWARAKAAKPSLPRAEHIIRLHPPVRQLLHTSIKMEILYPGSERGLCFCACDIDEHRVFKHGLSLVTRNYSQTTLESLWLEVR